MGIRIAVRRAPRAIDVDIVSARARIERAIAPDFRAWKGASAELDGALELARKKYLDHESVATTALAEAITSVAVTWVDLSPSYAIVGPGATDVAQSIMEPLVDLWIAERGLAFAIEALVVATEITQTIQPNGIGHASQGAIATRVCSRWRRLREHLSAASDDAYAKARDHGERVRDQQRGRVLTSYVFAWENWASEDVALPDSVALVGTSLDAKATTNVIRSATVIGALVDDGRLDAMVELLGDDAVEPLLALVARGDLDVTRPAQMLARFTTPAVARALLDAIDRDELARHAKRFFHRNPSLTLDAIVAAGIHGGVARKRTLESLLACAVAQDHAHACSIAPRVKDAHIKNLLASFGATKEWLGKKPPARLREAVKSFPEVASWLASGAPAAERGVLVAVRDVDALDAIVHAAALDAFPIACVAVDAMCASPNALKRVGRISHSALRPELTEYAAAKVEVLQEEVALNDDDVDDIVAPSFASGALDFGGRQFHARLDAELKPMIVDSSGNRRASFPRATKADDQALATRGAEAWANFRDTAGQEAAMQAERMEAAMLAHREFPRAIFCDVILPHAVMGVLARRILWRDARDLLFRVAEDGTFASQSDEPLEPEAPYRVAHPETLSADERARWSDVFASYEIVQPFAQLGR